MKHNLLELFNKNLACKYESVGDKTNYHIQRLDDTLIINFQCSKETEDWINNFRFRKVPYEDMANPYKVHQGFSECWDSVKNIVKEYLYDISLKKILIVGYSHGGALAFLCHEFCWFNREDLRDNIYTYAFGCPRVFGSWFVKKEIKQRWKNFTVVRNNNDIVTHLPFWLFGYRHLGKMIKTKTTNKTNSIDSHKPESYINALENYEKGATQ